MTTYLYPQNLKATANLWLWSLRDFAIMSIALLLSILILAQTRIIVPLAVTLCFGFLSIRLEDTTILQTHFQTPLEVTPEAREAIRKIQNKKVNLFRI